MLKNPKTLWLILAAVLITIFESLALSSLKLDRTEGIAIYGLVILIIGYQTIWKGVKAAVFFDFSSIQLLMLIAVSGAFYLGEYEEAAVVIILFSLAERLEFYGMAKSQSALERLSEQIPKYAYLKGMDEPIDVEQVSVGDLIVVKPHHLIPLDGEVIKGQAFVDEATITGEPIAKDKRPGDAVFAGTLNKQGVLEVKVNKTSLDSTLAKIKEQTLDALQNKAKTQTMIEAFATYYTPGILGLAIVWTVFSWLGGAPFDAGFRQALVLLVISCPCALVISTPICFYSAISNASAAGILIKGGKYLEAMGRLKAVAFDKTRTITRGEPIVTDIISYGNHTQEDLLRCAAGIELFSEHPIGKSVVDVAKQKKLAPHDVENFESIVGKGAKADCLVCYNKHHWIGKLEFILEEHSVAQPIIDKVEAFQKEGKTVIVISTQREIEGLIAIMDEIRSGSRKVIASLKKMGIKSMMLTGDHTIVARAVGGKVGIQRIKAQLLPDDKVKEVRKLAHRFGVVAMVGDGVNDAPALASAHVGISMTALSGDLATETASIVILNHQLKMLPYLVRLGRKTLGYIRFNTIFAVSTKFFFVALALLGLASISMAILADVGVTLFVIFNSLRLLKFQ